MTDARESAGLLRLWLDVCLESFDRAEQPPGVGRVAEAVVGLILTRVPSFRPGSPRTRRAGG